MSSLQGSVPYEGHLTENVLEATVDLCDMS